MGNLSTYMKNKILNHLLKNTAYTRPANLYLGLLTAEPNDDDSGGTITEVSGGSYARKAVNSWDAAASRATANSTLVTFPQSTSNWGEITHFAILDTLTLATGNIICHGAFTPARTFVSADTPKVVKGDLDISFNSGGISDYFANKVLDFVFGNVALSQPTSLFIGLSTSTITSSMTGSSFGEPSGNNYSRKNNDVWNAATGGLSDNTNELVFATPSGTWGTVKGTAILNAVTTGNILFYANLATARAIGTSDEVKFPSGGFDITLD